MVVPNHSRFCARAAADATPPVFSVSDSVSRLPLRNSDVPGTSTNAPVRFDLPRDVAPGETVELTVTLTGPAVPGTYTLRHRLKKIGIGWFDDILRTSVNVETFAAYSASPPRTWVVGEVKTYTIKVTNLGSGTWNASGANPVLLGVYFGGSSDLAPLTSEPQRFNLTQNVAAGQSITLTISVQAPEVGGNLVLRHRMVKEDVNWSTQMLKTSVAVQTLAATYFGAVPTTWRSGQRQTYSLTVKNTGTANWNLTCANPVNLGVYFGGPSDDPGSGSEPQRVGPQASSARVEQRGRS
jgi:hypothetical protein